MTRPVEISEIVAMLTARIEALAKALAPGGKIVGGEYKALNPVRSADKHVGSFSICVRGAKRGMWKDFADSETGGDALDLVAYVETGGDKARAIKWARAWLGIDDADPAELRRRKERAVAAKKEADAAAERQAAKRRGWAQRLYLSSIEDIRGTPVERYLAGRGITFERLGHVPRVLRFHPRCWHTPSAREWPAMVAAIVNLKGEMISIHRTYLEVNRDGSVTKAPLGKEAKMTLGLYGGGMIRLWRGYVPGKDGKLKALPRLKDLKPGASIRISEGVEDGLSVACVKPELPIGAAVALKNLAGLELPEAVTNIAILCQNDPKGSTAARDLDRAIGAHLRQGRSVTTPRPPADYKDWNDLLQGKRRSGEGVA